MKSQSTTNNNAFSVTLVAVECKQFYDRLAGEKIILSPDTLQVSHSLSIIIKNDRKLEIEVGMKYGDNNIEYSELKLLFQFDVTGLSQLMKVEDASKKISFDKALLFVVVPVAFSTARGYYAAKLEDSPLSRFPFPLLRTDALVSTCRIMLAEK